MILVSIQPFAPKKLFALMATITCLSTASCFADAIHLAKATQPTDKREASQSRAAGLGNINQLLLTPADHVQDLRGAA